MYNQREIQLIHAAFNLAIKRAPDSLAASKVYLAIFAKIVSEADSQKQAEPPQNSDPE